jgi:DNA-binding response OmpR family regulator
MRIDLVRRWVTHAGSEVRLTPTEYALLTTLPAYRGRLLTHQWLLTQV